MVAWRIRHDIISHLSWQQLTLFDHTIVLGQRLCNLFQTIHRPTPEHRSASPLALRLFRVGYVLYFSPTNSRKGSDVPHVGLPQGEWFYLVRTDSLAPLPSTAAQRTTSPEH